MILYPKPHMIHHNPMLSHMNPNCIPYSHMQQEDMKSDTVTVTFYQSWFIRLFDRPKIYVCINKTYHKCYERNNLLWTSDFWEVTIWILLHHYPANFWDKCCSAECGKPNNEPSQYHWKWICINHWIFDVYCWVCHKQNPIEHNRTPNILVNVVISWTKTQHRWAFSGLGQ